MGISEYHAKYYTHLIRRQISHGYEALLSVIQTAAIDLNPHQIEAALFALRSPFQRGCIFADETGLGKTIEAGLVLAQKWNIGKKQSLIIAPVNLVAQWQEELSEKFDLPSVIIDYKNFSEMQKAHGTNPFDQEKNVVIVTYNFAKDKAELLKDTEFDIVIIDEAHRLRSVYKEDNIIARTIRDAVCGRFKLLLTATPFQNSLMELYGLVSFIDPDLFPDLDTFKYMYTMPNSEREKNLAEIVPILQNICIRTLRKQVMQYIRYTERITITHEFTLTAPEELLQEKVLNYLHKNTISLFYKSQIHLIALMLLKLLASSSFALSATLYKLIERLKLMIKSEEIVDIMDILADEEYDEIVVKEKEKSDKPKLTQIDIKNINKEIEYLTECYDLAVSIDKNAKGDALLLAINEGFAKLTELGAQKKAVIFTESRRTQEYLYKLIKDNTDLKVVTFNGENNEKRNEKIYSQYVYTHEGKTLTTSGKRAALIDAFKHSADILLATEAAGEGLNLQFASLIINFDLPYNPQRIEQRIGRCHRYGQKFDVVVMNFINKNNLADIRIFEILSRKFKLFEGVFGASDEVLGEVDGIDFEKRVTSIYSECRTEQEIQAAFDRLQKEFDQQIKNKMTETKENVLSNFSQNIISKFDMSTKVNDSATYFEGLLWDVSKFKLGHMATFFEDRAPKRFMLTKTPYKDFHGNITRSFILDKNVKKYERYNPKNPLARRILDEYEFMKMYQGSITFEDNGTLSELKGKRGYMGLWSVSIHNFFENDTHLVFGAMDRVQHPLTQEQCQKMFKLKKFHAISGYDFIEESEDHEPREFVEDDKKESLKEIFVNEKDLILSETINRGLQLFDEESKRLDVCKENEIKQLYMRLSVIKKQIAQIEKDVPNTLNAKRKFEMMKEVGNFKKEHERRSQSLPVDINAVEKAKDDKANYIDDVYMNYYLNDRNLFFISWSVD